MASLIEQIEAVRAAFEVSDKGFAARKAAWSALGELAPKVDPADEGASMALCRFTRESLVAAGPWPTEALPVLRAMFPSSCTTPKTCSTSAGPGGGAPRMRDPSARAGAI